MQGLAHSFPQSQRVGPGDKKGTLVFLNSAKNSSLYLAVEGKPNQRLYLFPVMAQATSKVYVETFVESNLPFRRQLGRSSGKSC